jgi:hypothetical protein
VPDRRAVRSWPVLLALAAAALFGGCASSTPTTPISDQDRCTRYGGLWVPQVGDCRGGGAGGM